MKKGGQIKEVMEVVEVVDVDGAIKNVGSECVMATVECHAPQFGGENWWEDGTILYKIVNREN